MLKERRSGFNITKEYLVELYYLLRSFLLLLTLNDLNFICFVSTVGYECFYKGVKESYYPYLLHTEFSYRFLLFLLLISFCIGCIVCSFKKFRIKLFKFFVIAYVFVLILIYVFMIKRMVMILKYSNLFFYLLLSIVNIFNGYMFMYVFFTFHKYYGFNLFCFFISILFNWWMFCLCDHILVKFILLSSLYKLIIWNLELASSAIFTYKIKRNIDKKIEKVGKLLLETEVFDITGVQLFSSLMFWEILLVFTFTFTTMFFLLYQFPIILDFYKMDYFYYYDIISVVIIAVFSFAFEPILRRLVRRSSYKVVLFIILHVLISINGLLIFYSHLNFMLFFSYIMYSSLYGCLFSMMLIFVEGLFGKVSFEKNLSIFLLVVFVIQMVFSNMFLEVTQLDYCFMSTQTMLAISYVFFILILIQTWKKKHF